MATLKGTYYTYWGTNSNTPSSYGDVRFYFKIYETSNGVTANTSTMKAECYAQVYTHSEIYAGTNGKIPVILRVMFNGVYKTVSGNATVTGEYHKTYTTKIGDVYYTAPHNEDGSGTVTNQNSGKINSSSFSYSFTTHQKFNLIKINRGALIKNDTSSNEYKDFGTDVTFTLEQTITDQTSDVYYKIGDTTHYIGIESNLNNFTYQFPTDLINNYPNNAEISLTVYCKTLQTDYITQTVVYLKVPDTYIPSIDLTINDSGNVPDDWNIWVKGKSKISGSISGEGISGSNIKSYSAVANSSTYTTQTFETDFLKNSGNQTLTATVTDTRGRTNTITKTIEVYDYFTPSLSSYSVVRCDENGKEIEDGSYGKVKCKYSIAPCNNKNDKSLIVKCGEITKTFALSSYNETYIATDLFSDLSIGSNYEFEFYLVDTFNPDGIKYGFKMLPAYTTMSLLAGGKGVTLGQVAIEEGFNVYMASDFKNELTKKGIDVATIEDIQQNIITANLTSDASQITTYGYIPVVFDNSISVGSSFTLQNDGSVLIGAGVNNIKLSGILYASYKNQSSTNSYNMSLVIIKNELSTEGELAVYKKIVTKSESSSYYTLQITNYLIPVQEGDKIYCVFHASSNNLYRTPLKGSYITIEKVN